MCRMLLARGEVTGREIVAAAEAMSLGQTADHERFEDDGRSYDHLDGWGVLLQAESGAWHCWRGEGGISPVTAGEASAFGRTRFALAHVRKASVPRYLGVQFAHPVEAQRDGRPCYFMHNGYAPDVGAMIRRPEGWDSERLLEYLWPALGKTEAALRERLEALPESTTSANFMYLVGDQVTVVNWYPLASPHPRYYAYRVAEEGGRLIIASDPVARLAAGAPFQRVRNQSIVRFDANTPTEQIVEQLVGSATAAV